MTTSRRPGAQRRDQSCPQTATSRAQTPARRPARPADPHPKPIDIRRNRDSHHRRRAASPTTLAARSGLAPGPRPVSEGSTAPHASQLNHIRKGFHTRAGRHPLARDLVPRSSCIDSSSESAVPYHAIPARFSFWTNSRVRRALAQCATSDTLAAVRQSLVFCPEGTATRPPESAQRRLAHSSCSPRRPLEALVLRVYPSDTARLVHRKQVHRAFAPRPSAACRVVVARGAWG